MTATPNTAALTALLERVEAGDDMSDAFCPIWHHNGLCIEAENAFTGSLDAAKALHEAVLPGWWWTRAGFVMTVTTDHTGWGNGRYASGRDDTNPARAWLVAILRALAAPVTPANEGGV